jgi:hypothetical protein
LAQPEVPAQDAQIEEPERVSPTAAEPDDGAPKGEADSSRDAIESEHARSVLDQTLDALVPHTTGRFASAR